MQLATEEESGSDRANLGIVRIMIEEHQSTTSANIAASPLRVRLKGERIGTSRNMLFICPDNSAASIVAEALMEHLGGDGFRAFSAGSHPAPNVHSLTAEVLKGRRIWRGDLRSKSYQDFFVAIRHSWTSL